MVVWFILTFLAGLAGGVVAMACVAMAGRESERERPRAMSARPRDEDLRAWCRANWDRVPPERRRACLDTLRVVVPAERLAAWRAQHERDEEIGSDELGFHFGGGMSIRNLLRQVLPDDYLPAVVGPAGGYPLGEQVRNWDDFYTGALEELCEGSVR